MGWTLLSEAVCRANVLDVGVGGWGVQAMEASCPLLLLMVRWSRERLMDVQAFIEPDDCLCAHICRCCDHHYMIVRLL